MRPLALLLALAACSAELPIFPDAGPCGGACGPGTACQGGQCVATDGGELADGVVADDASTDAGADAPASDGPCLRPVWPDQDGDGYGTGAPRMAACDAVTPGFGPMSGDCDDRNPAIHPGTVEACDGVDSDCDGRADNDPAQTRPINDAETHPLTRWCVAQLARYPQLAARVQTTEFAAVRCRPDSGRCGGQASVPGGFLCWRDRGEIPCVD